MSEAIELYKKDGSTAGIYYCSECRVVHATKEQAEQCHGERICACGQKLSSRYRNECDKCWYEKSKKESAEKELARFEKANKISEGEYQGGMVNDGDNFYEDVEEAIDKYLEGQEPEYVWACKDVGVPLVNSDSIVENMLENMWEDADSSDLNGLDELDVAIKKFNEANKSIAVWQPDYSTAILVKKREKPPEETA